MFDFLKRLRNSLNIIFISLKHMLKHKQLFLFPIFKTFLTSFVIYLAFFLITYLKTKTMHFVLYFIILIFFFIIIMSLHEIIKAFTNVSLAHNILTQLNNKPESVLSSLKTGFYKLKVITQWATLYTFMHYDLSVIMVPHEHEKKLASDKNTLKILDKISHFAWQITTFLIYPIMANENIHLTTLYKHSMELMKHKFGQNIIAKFNFNIITFILNSLLFILICLAFFYCCKSTINLLIISILIFLSVFIGSLITATQTIFQTCVYAYTKEQPTGPFSKDIIHKYLA